MKLSSNTVLITGGTSGIGRALALALSAQGNEVVVCGRDPGRLAALQLAAPGIIAYRCDIADDEDQERLVSQLREAHTGLNLLVNNAGIQHHDAFTDGASHLARIDEEININLRAHLRLTDRLLPGLLECPDAAIVNLTSALALVPKQDAPVYCATKAAMRSFSQALRYQLEGTPVRVFGVLPPLVDTAMTRGRGRGKISPEALVVQVLRAMARDRYEVRVGKTKLLFPLHRLFPSLAARMLRHG